MFGYGFPLGERGLRECAVYIVQGIHRRLLGYWEEAVAMAPLTGDDPDDQAHQIAEIAVTLMRERRATRPLVSFIRRDMQRITPFGDRREREHALQTALIYRVMDIARPGSLSDEERMLAITGQESGDARGLVPMPPSDIAQVARTLTLREASALRSLLVAQWETGVVEARPDTTVLEDVLYAVTELRLDEDSAHLDRPLPLELIRLLNAEAEELLRQLDDGYIPGQLSFDIDEMQPST